MNGVLDDDTVAALVVAAREAREKAYAPYSRFRVGAAVLTTDGAVFRGVNVENASFPAGVCAEQSAVCAAVTAGDRRIVAVAISADADPPATPCGVCRQTLNEFNPDMLVITENVAGRREVYRLRDLLPHGFGPASWTPPGGSGG